MRNPNDYPPKKLKKWKQAVNHRQATLNILFKNGYWNEIIWYIMGFCDSSNI